MNSYLLRNLSGITSASIEKYLLFTGWVRDDTFNSTRMWVFKSKSDPEFKIAVPASEKATDFYPQVYNLIQTLSVVDGKTEQEIIDSLKSAYTDRLQFRIITEESQGGKLPLDYAARCLEGLKDLVLYAACAEENAKPICARTYNSAKRALEKFQFGQTQIGSFIINIDVQVADEENEQLYLIDAGAPPDEPPEHKIIKRIGTAITQVDGVANRQISITQLSIILISLITLGFSEVLTSDFPRSRLRFFRTLDFGFSEVWISAARRLRFRCILAWFVLYTHEAENIDFRRSAQPLLDPPYEAHAFGAVQLRKQLDRLIRLAAELFARLLQRKVDIHMAIIVHPAVSHGQAHAVQHEAVQQLRVGGEPSKVRLGDQELGDAEKGVLLGVHAEMVRKDRLRHI